MSENVAAGTGFTTPFHIQDYMTSGGTGGVQTLTIDTVTGYAGASNPNIVGAQFNTTLCGTSNADVCAGQNGGGAGHGFGFSTAVEARAGSGTDTEIVSYEADIQADFNGGNLSRKVGIQIISVNADVGHAANAALDDALLIDGGTGAGFTYGIYVGSCIPSCGNVLSASGTIMASGAFSTTNGIDLSSTALSGNAFKSAGFQVDHNGAIIGNGKASFGDPSLSGVAGSWQNTVGVCTFTPAASGSGTWSCSSDLSMKYDAHRYADESAIDKVMSFQVDEYKWRSDNSIGVSPIAQEAMLDHPSMVHRGDDGRLTLDQLGSWELVAAIQAVERKVERLEARTP